MRHNMADMFLQKCFHCFEPIFLVLANKIDGFSVFFFKPMEENVTKATMCIFEKSIKIGRIERKSSVNLNSNLKISSYSCCCIFLTPKKKVSKNLSCNNAMSTYTVYIISYLKTKLQKMATICKSISNENLMFETSVCIEIIYGFNILLFLSESIYEIDQGCTVTFPV